MSPVNLIQREEIQVRGSRSTNVFMTYMHVNLDYLDLYRWFIPTRQESYKLDLTVN